ncbi:hypothetical protein K2X05_00525, partial [bacterium]|nr:hypothetical protein [bacterium]
MGCKKWYVLSFVLALSGCKTPAEDSGTTTETYNSITNLSVATSGATLTSTPLISWQLGFPVFSFLEVGLGSSATSGADVANWAAVGTATTAT